MNMIMSEELSPGSDSECLWVKSKRPELPESPCQALIRTPKTGWIKQGFFCLVLRASADQ